MPYLGAAPAAFFRCSSCSRFKAAYLRRLTARGCFLGRCCGQGFAVPALGGSACLVGRGPSPLAAGRAFIVPAFVLGSALVRRRRVRRLRPVPRRSVGPSRKARA